MTSRNRSYSNRSFLLLLLMAVGLSLRMAGAGEEPFPVRGLSVSAPSVGQVDRFVRFIHEGLAPRSVNTLILRVDFNFEYTSHPELSRDGVLTKAAVQKLVTACEEEGIRIIPQINLLGHQSWATRTGALLREYPEFDETPWVKMPKEYKWPNPDGLYCKSYCPLHPGVHEVVFALVDEICEAFSADAFHAGMDEVFYLGEERCPRCGGKDKAELFAGEVNRIQAHLAKKGRELWIWGDRLLDGDTTGLGEWEASTNGTHPAIDLISRDVVICDWHYERADPTAVYFALKGFRVVTCPWKNQRAAVQQLRDLVRWRAQSSPKVAGRLLGMVQTVWSGAEGFLDEYDGVVNGDSSAAGGAAGCFVRVYEEIADGSLAGPPDR